MKKLLALFVVLFVLTPAFCDTATPSPNTPASLTAIADGLHLGDNGSLSTLRDVINGRWLPASSTLVYKEYYISLNGGVAYLPNTPGANGIIYPSIRFHLGELLSDKVPFVHDFVNTEPIVRGFMNYFTVGSWITRDFDYGVYRGGYDLAFTFKFGPSATQEKESPTASIEHDTGVGAL